MQVVIDASPSGVTKERSQSYQRPLQAKRVQTIAQTTAPTPKRPNRATSAPRAFPSIVHPRISQGGLQQHSDNMAKSGLEADATAHWQHSGWKTPPCSQARLEPALSGMRLLACLIVAPQRGYDEPAILSYAISSFCPTSADGLQAP